MGQANSVTNNNINVETIGQDNGETVIDTRSPIEDIRSTNRITEDMAPAERKKIKQQIEQAKLAEQQKRLEELIAAEKEKDPDALEEDIRQQFFKAQATKRFAEQRVDETLVQQNFKQPAISLGTTMQTAIQQTIEGNDPNWKQQQFTT